jgi:hypothetical protein
MSVYNTTETTETQTVKSTTKKMSSSVMASCSCPVCNEEMRIDTLIRHVIRRHKAELVASMPITVRKQVVALQTPIVYGFQNENKILYGCLCCGKGHTAASKKSGNLYGTVSKTCSDHQACRACWKDYAEFYTDLETPHTSLPFKMSRNDAPKKAQVKPVATTKPVSEESEGSAPLRAEHYKALIKLLNPPLEDEEEDDEELTEEEMRKYEIKYANSCRKQINHLLDELEKARNEIQTLKGEPDDEDEDDEIPEESTSSSLPADVADLQELLAEAKEREAGFKEEIESLRSQLFAANMNAQALPTLEVSEKTDALEAELEELRAAYDKLRTEAIDREAELEAEIEGMVARGTVEPSLLGPLNKVFYIDSDNQAVEDPTVNDMVRGVIAIAKEALIQTEKDQIMMKQYGKRIQQLETLISRDFD